MYEFQECNDCAKKPGSSDLCLSCFHNRKIISELIRLLDEKNTVLGSALSKFAPDLMKELVQRYNASNDELEVFLKYLKKE